MRGRLLPRLDAYGLREHVKGYGLLPGSELAIAAKTMHILQKSLLPLTVPDIDQYRDQYCLANVARHKYAE
jgi:hypothetical protein